MRIPSFRDGELAPRFWQHVFGTAFLAPWPEPKNPEKAAQDPNFKPKQHIAGDWWAFLAT
jgi:hypothetical protein